MKQFSIIIPAYNEAGTIEQVISEIKETLEPKFYDNYEIIVVNDGSTDGTKEILEKIQNIKVINHSQNKGYGASIKNGTKNSKYEWGIWFDGDGQHNPEDIKKLLSQDEKFEMVVGERRGYKGPLIRQPGKKLLGWLANYLVEQKIPDINSGFRLIKKGIFLQFVHLFPNGFSISTTSTLAFFKEGLDVKYIPITIREREKESKSTVKISDGFNAILLMLRLIMLFNPLRVFIPISIFTGTLTFLFLVWDIIVFNISGTTIILFLTTIMVFCFGLLADQVSSIKRGYKN